MQDKAFECPQCGGELHFGPEVQSLKCPHCEHTVEIAHDAAAAMDVWREQDFHAILANVAEQQDTVVTHTIKCTGCAAETTLPDNVDVDDCPYCGTTLARENETERKLIKPQAMLPFKVPQRDAMDSFKTWIKSRWFAPNKLKEYARVDGKLQGVYMPCWTFDSNTVADYHGQRGEHYWDTEYYTDAEGKRQSRRVRKTRWYSASGRVHNTFDDVLVLASDSLPRKYAEALEPWDLPSLGPCQPEFMSGFKTENYTIDLEPGFERGKQLMEPTIIATIKRDIGGDEQRIWGKTVIYNDVTFKHILLPVWVSAFRYNNKVFRFLVNARTGEVQGERPWSAWKITCTVLGIIAVIVTVVLLVNANQ